MRTKRIKLYSFKELSTEAQAQVIYRGIAEGRFNTRMTILDAKAYYSYHKTEFLSDGTFYNQ